MGIQSKGVPVGKRLDSQHFTDRVAAQRHLANVERHIAEGRASVLRQHEIIGRLQNAESRRSETASIARAFLHQMERRLEMSTSLTVIGFKTNCAKRPQFTTLYIGPVRPAGRGSMRLWETSSTKFHNVAL